MIIIDLIFNLALLVSFSVLSGFVDLRWRRTTMQGVILQGLLFGLVAVFGMLNPYKFAPGIIFDGRSVVLGLCALFFGPTAGFIAAGIAFMYRLALGGGGVFMGLSVIITSAIIGSVFHYLIKIGKFKINTLNLYIVGLLIHITMVVLILAIPSPLRMVTFKTLTFTILGIYPVATALIGKILKDQSDGNDRRRAEFELVKAKERAESADRLKTAFMNNISHEVRTPLNSILGFGNLIAQPDISEDEKAKYYSHIKTSSNRLLNTITNYMDISLIASGNIEVRQNAVDMHKIFHQLFKHFQPLCAEKNLGLQLEIPEGRQRFILQTDSELFWKIMSHLLDNAIKFTNSGRINFGFNIKQEIEPREVTILEFFVKDTGIGIGSESLSMIFESFKQEELSRNRGFEGSGLGLSIAQGLVHLLGGEMHVTSVKAAGSIFSFSMNFQESVISESIIQTVDNSLKQKKPVILIAEDDESNLMFLQVILKKKFVSIITALNGQEAVVQCQDHPEISLVLMDIKMPVMDGLQATREIKSFRKDLPIIACTAFALSGDEKMVEEAGCDDYISKPVNKEGLLEKLRKYGVMV